MKYPIRVVVINKLINTVIIFLEGRKCFCLQHLFFQGAVKPLYYPVALWRSYKRFGHLQSQEFHFIHTGTEKNCLKMNTFFSTVLQRISICRST